MSARSTQRKKKATANYTPYIVAVVGIVALPMILYMTGPKAEVKKTVSNTLVNDPDVISNVASQSSSWVAGASDFFEGQTLKQMRTLGRQTYPKAESISSCPAFNRDTPESFDSRQEWPKCFGAPVYNQGNCSSSYAIPAASSLANRYCIEDQSEHAGLQLSPQSLISCDKNNKGCKGGDLEQAFQTLMDRGTVTENCFPYKGKGISCRDKCDMKALKALTYCGIEGEDRMKKEIMANGPVVVPLPLHDDFLVYKAGVYSPVSGSSILQDGRGQDLMHAVKVIGWGVDGADPYWLVENSWGQGWGEMGFARILRTVSDAEHSSPLLEQNAITAMPGNRKIRKMVSSTRYQSEEDKAAAAAAEEAAKEAAASAAVGDAEDDEEVDLDAEPPVMDEDDKAAPQAFDADEEPEEEV